MAVSTTGELRTGEVDCNEGVYSTGSSDTCSACPSNTFQPNAGQSSCSSCKVCGVGFYIASACTSTEDTSCAPCEAGKAGDGTSTSCTACVDETFQPNVGQSTCS